MNSYGLVYGAAIVVCSVFACIRLVRAGWPLLIVMRGAAVTIWGGLAGAFIFHYALTFIPGTVLRPDDRWGGSTVIGMLIGGAIAAAIYLQAHNISWGRAFDVGCIPVPLGQAIGRLGCFKAGCCHGKPTESWLALELANSSGEVALRYPTQLMSSAANLLIFATLIGFEAVQNKRGLIGWPFPGFIFLLFVDLYCAKRFTMEFFRASDQYFVAGLTWAQAMAIVGFVGATTTMTILAVRAKDHDPVPDPQ